MIESEGITESVKAWRTDVPTKIIDTLGLKKTCLMPPIRKSWAGTSRTGKKEIFVDHSQIVQLECVRSAI